MTQLESTLPPPPPTPVPAEYTLPQTVFMLSLGSNALFGKAGKEEDLLAELCTFLVGSTPPNPYSQTTHPTTMGIFFSTLNTSGQSYSWLNTGGQTNGDWRVVWGPQIFVPFVDGIQVNTGAANTMYVAYSPQNATYVVAVAGTNPAGILGAWEDLDVSPAHMVTWPTTTQPYVPPKKDAPNPGPKTTLAWKQVTSPFDPHSVAATDQGTADGITYLYQMCDPWTGIQLVDFLNAQDQTNNTLIFTGHSLGGALAPCLAMLLYPNGTFTQATSDAPNPERSQWQNIYITATAGPTPGTPAFAALFNTPIPNPADTTSYKPEPHTTPTPLSNTAPASKAPYPPVLVAGSAPNTLSRNGAMPMPWWNVNYANIYDVVPRAWTLLDYLIETPNGEIAQKLPSFFANGALLEYLAIKGIELDMAGNLVSYYVTNAKGMVDYASGTTPYYAQCLPQYIINGTWGYWTPNAANYPGAYEILTETPGLVGLFTSTKLAPPSKTGPLLPWILNAHLDQYSFALLGFPALGLS